MNPKRGQYVQIWFDTGAMGAQILYGRVVKSGPVTYTVEWESGLRNRIRHGHPGVKLAEKQDEVHAIFARLDRT